MIDKTDQKAVERVEGSRRRITTTPLDEVRIALIRARIARLGSVALNYDEYRLFRINGITPATLDKLIGLMEQRGEVVLHHNGDWVSARLTEPEK
jgi:hypothetical protein